MRLLYSHCLYIDDFRRLEGVTEVLHLAKKFDKRPEQIPRYSLRAHPRESLRLALLKYATSMYLGPFSRYYDVVKSENQLLKICKLLLLVASDLKRLILFIPTCSTYGVEQTLFNDEKYSPMCHTLSQLTSLEVFSSVEDDLWTALDLGANNQQEKVPWTHWPNLRTLSLRFLYPNEEIWGWLASLEKLEGLIITEGDEPREEDFKQMYQRGRAGKPPGKKLELVFVDYIDREMNIMGRESWSDQDLLRIRQFGVPNTNAVNYSTKCRDWVLECLLRGDEMV